MELKSNTQMLAQGKNRGFLFACAGVFLMAAPLPPKVLEPLANGP